MIAVFLLFSPSFSRICIGISLFSSWIVSDSVLLAFIMAGGKVAVRRGPLERLTGGGPVLSGDGRVGGRDRCWIGQKDKNRDHECRTLKRTGGDGISSRPLSPEQHDSVLQNWAVEALDANCHGVSLPVKRRKFSPIVWDPTSKGSVDAEVCTVDLSRLSQEPVIAHVLGDVSTIHACLKSTQEAYTNYQQEPGQLEEEDFSHGPNILTSRWAYDDDLDDEMFHRVNDEYLGRCQEEGKESSSDSTLIQREGSEEGFEDNDCMVVDGREGVDSSLSGESELEADDTAEFSIPESRDRNMLQECRNISEYEKLGKISEGSYGIVYKARDKKSGEIVALKKLKLGTEREGFPLYFLREINTLLSFDHPSVVNAKEVVVDDSDTGFDNVFMVMEYMEHDLKSVMEARKEPFSQSEVKCLMLQLLEGVKYLHDHWVLHRDLKTSNLLLDNSCKLKICDFGMARQYGSLMRQYTSLVVTLWYRAPELLLGAKEYSTSVDMWSVGCIMAELLLNKPLFDGKTELDQLDKIFRTLGTPNEKIWPGYSQLPGVKVNYVQQQYNMLHKKFPRTSFTSSPVLSESGLDLLSKLLAYDPEKRISAEEALSHFWFREVPLPKAKEFMPTLPSRYAQMRQFRRMTKSLDVPCMSESEDFGKGFNSAGV